MVYIEPRISAIYEGIGHAVVTMRATMLRGAGSLGNGASAQGSGQQGPATTGSDAVRRRKTSRVWSGGRDRAPESVRP